MGVFLGVCEKFGIEYYNVYQLFMCIICFPCTPPYNFKHLAHFIVLLPLTIIVTPSFLYSFCIVGVQ